MNAHTTKTADALLWSAPTAAPTHRPASAIALAFEAVSAWSRRRRMAAELKALSDRELADIGLSRGDIGHIVRQR